MTINSPWAMLITPIWPKIIAKPNPISKSTENKLSPENPCIRVMFKMSEKVMKYPVAGMPI